MKKLFILSISALIWVSCTQREIRFLESKDAYFGLARPGVIPEIFAPGIVSDSSCREHSQIAISPDGREIYWSHFSHDVSEQIYFSKFENDKWTSPAMVSFLQGDSSLINGGPTFSPNGEKLFFYSRNRPGGQGYIDAWYVGRTNSGWSSPINVGKPYNSDKDDRPPIFTEVGNAYNMGRNFVEDKKEFLKFNYSDGTFSNPIEVSIYEDFSSWWPLFVSPDESYLIFPSHQQDGFGGLDLYVSFKDKDQKWGLPINLGPDINTNLTERFPIVSPDGKYLFFMRQTETWDIFWVSAEVLQKLQSSN